MNKIREFLDFRKKFTAAQWFEINRMVDALIREKATKIELDDFDIEILEDQIAQSKIIPQQSE